jgi:sulfur relay (sulfurtransferase) DsrC/TusE family protein
MTHIKVLENVAVRTENGFMVPVSAWEQNIAVETVTALSCALPRSHVHILQRIHDVQRVFVVLIPSNFR